MSKTKFTYILLSFGFFLMVTTCMYAVLEKSLYDTEYSENTNTQPSDDSDSERQADDDYYITNVLAPLEINFHFDRYFDSGDTKVTHIPIRLHCPPPNIS